MREGDVIDGVTLGTSVRSVALNNANEAAFVWTDTSSTSVEHLFYAADAGNLTNAQLLLSTGDQIDTDGNGSPDAIITDFNAFNNGDISLRSDGWIYLDVDLDDLQGNDLGEAAIRVQIPTPGALALLAVGGLFSRRRRR